MKKIFSLITLLLLISVNCYAVDINMEIIKYLESSNNKMSYNKNSGASGLYGITSICLKEYNNYHSNNKIHKDDLFDELINEHIAKWYFNERIPTMLKSRGKEISVNNILVAYNAGITRVGRSNLPSETKEYLIRYADKIKEGYINYD